MLVFSAAGDPDVATREPPKVMKYLGASDDEECSSVIFSDCLFSQVKLSTR